MLNPTEGQASVPTPVQADRFNPGVALPHGLSTEDVRMAMNDFIEFLGLIDGQLHARGMSRLECTLMPANFSSMVGEFMNDRIPFHCAGLERNKFHNGHPDLLPAGRYPGDAVQYGDTGIEVKSSRYASGFQGHNAEASWLMVFVIDVNSPNDLQPVRPFRFRRVLGAQLEAADWSEAGRNEGSRRTPTASVLSSGVAKMEASWIYWAD